MNSAISRFSYMVMEETVPNEGAPVVQFRYRDDNAKSAIFTIKEFAFGDNKIELIGVEQDNRSNLEVSYEFNHEDEGFDRDCFNRDFPALVSSLVEQAVEEAKRIDAANSHH